jgi:murein L,D-transpeptidase YafK
MSALNEPSILVEKSAGRLTLMDGGAVVKVYPAITGSNAGDKVREGDRRTPEGLFYVCYKNPDSLYTLSLGLSYPNEEDAARGLRDGLLTQAQHDAIVAAIRAGGQPPWDTPLGGEIMIHGCKNDRSGTAGCVAVSDDDIRELYPLLPEGTPVTIVP